MTHDLAATEIVLAITLDLCDQSYLLSTICAFCEHVCADELSVVLMYAHVDKEIGGGGLGVYSCHCDYDAYVIN